MSIHTIGDSHSFFGWTGIISHHLGAVLCYSFGREKLQRCDIRNFNIKNNDSVVFCFGEIDCRSHIHKYINDTNTYQNIIDNIVDEYVKAIELNLSTSGIKLKNTCIYNIVPPVRKDTVPQCDGALHLGSDEERKGYVLYFNKKLKEKCVENNYLFFDVYDKYVDQNGFLKQELSDTVHIRDGVYLTDFINKNNF